MFVQKAKDSAWLRPAMADYILLFRHPEENPETPVKTDVSNEEWILFAHPIWYGIKESDVLKYRDARDEEDEKHICPLQLETIERCIRLWSNPGDTVLSPFAGIGSEGYVSKRFGRKFIGIELKRSYFDIACKHLNQAEAEGVRSPTVPTDLPAKKEDKKEEK
jgi:DNA modification methylase